MGAVKSNLIAENYSCSHFLDVDDCVECQYAMRNSHLPVKYRPQIKTWYNKPVKKGK